MEDNNKEKQSFWYKIEINRCDEKGYENKKRFELIMKFEPGDMYELVRQIVMFSVSDEETWRAIPDKNERS